MKMFRWSLGLTWYGHVIRSGDDTEAKTAYHFSPPGRRLRGRPKKRWLDRLVEDMCATEITPGDALNRVKRWKVYCEFNRVVEKHLREDLFDAFDRLSSSLLDIFRKEKGLVAQLQGRNELLRHTKSRESFLASEFD
ncbi:hypothetical protein KOW79_007794 [Hemibagrus wyckioides]|uniref:Uncharacterized protein n=1 Tax=Hemibagrus wyckioides TaxID=337641 RepID=A0A9D3NVN9_9TELE|nr:hypothetical protein KOW79_007794 [Hemibagrus wyckioides]